MHCDADIRVTVDGMLLLLWNWPGLTSLTPPRWICSGWVQAGLFSRDLLPFSLVMDGADRLLPLGC